MLSTKKTHATRSQRRTRKPASAKLTQRRVVVGAHWKRTHASPCRKRADHNPRRKPWLPPGVSELEYELTEILSRHVGERFEDQRTGEGAIEVLCRIIRERDAAMTLLALDRMKNTMLF